jgi:hypothetical protein
MPNRVIELMDDMHLSSQATFMDYYTAMQNNNISNAANILKNNPSVANQIMNADNINILLNETYRRELTPKIDIDYFLEGLLSVYQKMIDYTRVMGEWDANTQYNVHNLVYYNEKAYYVYPNTTPPIGTPPTDTQYWKEYDIKGFQGYGGINLNFKFNWDNTQSYKVGDVVIFQNKMWYAVADNTNYEPNLNHYPWVVISMPKLPDKTPIQRAIPNGYDIGDFWFQITQGDEVIVTTWGIRQPEPTPRFASSAFSIGTDIYIAGGIKSNFDRTNVVEMFDTVLGTWSTKANMPTIRARAAGFSIGNNGYCVGGIDANGTVLNINEVYDSTTNSWSTKTSYPMPIISSGVATETLGYIIGGETNNNVLTGSGYSYNPTSNAWTEIIAKPTLTRGHTLATDGNVIYAIGGIDNNKNTLGINEAYTISSNTWSQKDTLAVPRSYLASFVQSGMIYAVGGLNSSWYSVDTNEKYDIANNEWITDMPMNYKRSSLNALVSGTRGFAIGGIDFANSDIRGYNEQYNIDDIPSDFEMVIDTTLDSTGSKQVTIPTPEGGNYDYWVDWGDGLTSTKITTYNDPQATHTYAEDGEYNIKLMGTLDRLKFTGNIANDLKSVTKCILNFSTITDMFNTCSNLESVCDGIFDQSINVTNANNTFKNCAKLKTIPLGLFDNNNVITEFISTFEGCGIVSIPTGLFNGNNLATNFSTTFYKCSGITSIPSGLFNNNKNVTNFYGVFSRCFNLQSIPDGLFASNSLVENFSYAFNVCEKITSIPSNLFGNANGSVFNYSNMFSLVTIPEGLFQYAQNTTNYDNIFASCPITAIPNNCFNGNNASVENIFDVTKITSIGDNALKGLAIPSGFFQGATSLITIGNNIFDTNVTDMLNMFNGCNNLTTLGNIDMSNVTTIDSTMFNNCTNLVTVKGFKDRNTMTNPTIKMDFSMSSCQFLSHDSLINISESLVTMTPTTRKTLSLHSDALSKLSTIEKLDIINRYWDIEGYSPTSDLNQNVANELVQSIYGNANTEAQTHITTSLYYYVKLLNSSSGAVIDVYAVDKNTGIVYLADNIPQYEYIIYGGVSTTDEQTFYVPKGSDGDTTGAILKQNINTILTDNPTYKIIEVGSKNTGKLKTKNSGLEQISNASELFSKTKNITELYVHGDFNPTNMSKMFEGCATLERISFDNLNSINTTDMSFLFSTCSNLTSVPSLDTTNCVDMQYMFASCSHIVDWSFVSEWNTSKVINMSNMFRSCFGLTSMPILNMSSVTDASEMFENCANMTNIAPNVIGNKVQNAEGMFQLCQSLDLKNIGDYTTIFGHNNNLTNVSYLFDECSALTKVGVHDVFTLDESGDFPVQVIDETKINNQLFTYCPNITNMSHIFDGCHNLGSEDNGIPMGIFYHCPNLQDISYAFSSCWNIQNPFSYGGLSLNKVLFVNNPELVNVSHLFENAHVGFIGENTANPTLLFPVQTKIEDASYLWNGCEMADAQGYELIPFIYTSKVLKNIEGMFMGQTFSRDISSNYDSYNPQYSWDNLQNIIPALENCSNLFSGNTNLTGNATAMIESLQKITTLTNHEKAFEGCTKLSDYNSIPTDWK